MSLPILAAARDAASTLGKPRDVARFDAMIAEKLRAGRVWRDTCGKDEVCTSARAFDYGERLRIELTATQSDETPPYVEIYVDDLRRAEGEVRETRAFDLALPPGLHDVEVRLVNPRTRNGIQRRIRLS